MLHSEDEPPLIRLQPEFASALAVIHAGLLGGPGGESLIADGQQAIQIEGDADGDGQVDEGESIVAPALVLFFRQVRQWSGHTPDAFGGAAIPDAADFDLGLNSPSHFEAFTIQVGEGLPPATPDVEDPDYVDLFGLAGALSDRVKLTGPDGAGDVGFVPLGLPLPYACPIHIRWMRLRRPNSCG